MKYLILFVFIALSILYAGTVDYEQHNQMLDENFTLRDFVVWRTISDFNPMGDWWIIYGVLENTSEDFFKNITLHYDFFSNNTLVSTEATLVDYFTYSENGMQPHSIAFTVDPKHCIDFDRIELSITYDLDSGRDFFLIKNALVLDNPVISEISPGFRFSILNGILRNASLGALESPRIFCCSYNSGNLVTIEEITSADLDKDDNPMQPGEEITINEYVELPTVYDSIAFYTHYAIETSGPVELPVELAAFRSSVFKDYIELYWITESEKNNYGFTIEKLLDETWVFCGFVAGHNTTTEQQAYTFSDRNIQPGIHQYRLVQIDTDGTRTEYPSISVFVEMTLAEFFLPQNYPNPFNAETWIQYALPEASHVKLQVYNATGKFLMTLVNEKQIAGSYQVKLDMSSFPSGIYYYTLFSSTGKKTGSMMLVK